MASLRHVLFSLVLFAVASACREDPGIKPPHQLPVADARVLRDGVSTNGKDDAAALTFAYSGMPVAITLDGSQSYSSSSTIVTYRWLSGTLAPEGGTPLPDDSGVMLRWAPPGAPPNWPGDVKQPQVSLDQGIWFFTLWVIDDSGAISDPDTIKITVGSVVDPMVQQCADQVVSTEPEACRQCLCKQGDMCRAAVTADKCDQTCWNLINCVAANCPDFTAMAAKGDYSCLTANCSAYTSGSTGATPVTPCFTACSNECSPGASTMDGGGGSRDAAE
jgi:hypothetical protein